MFICNNCNKEYQYESDYNRHINRKTPCGKIKKELECKACNLKFKYKSKYTEHEKTTKHIQNTIKYNKELKNKIIDNEINKIQKLELEIQNLKNENNRLKQNFKMHNNEYIYIIHCAQYINTNIYKIGQTKNIMNRFKQYPKGSEMLFMFSCNNARQIESKILNYLKSNNNYIWYKDAGNEYFQCELDNLKSDIYNIINS